MPTQSPLFPVAEVDDGFTIVMPAVLDLHNRQQLRHVVDDLLERPALVIRLDCRVLVYADSSGLGCLISLNRAAKRLGKRIVLADLVSPDMQVLFELTKIETLFTFEPPLRAESAA